MPFCDHCGGEIEFRHIGGRVIPMHLSGGCSAGGGGGGKGRFAVSRFESVQSYLDPNARCPVCGADVYFYRSPYNGRVFFDDVGWPWPKHGCTDHSAAQSGEVWSGSKSSYRFHFRDKEGRALATYKLGEVKRHEDHFLLLLNSTENRSSFWIAINHADMSARDVTQTDIEQAPSLVISKSLPLELGFMCGRLQSVVTIPASASA